ncbi:hypothetical protein CPB85DRAFT_1361896 [Mucidula mucida]|nr:hypothetical protein CPB85DRAFT_1361896 [Mucidula mucida]
MSDHITVSDSSQWPPQVSTISQYLTNDLPPSLLSAQPTLSPRASRLWTEVTKRHPPSTSYEDLPHELLDIMDTLLSTVSIIRTLRDSNATSRETRSFVSLLLYALLRSCYPDAHVSENVRFARSYFDKLGDMTVGDATMLVSVISPLSGHLSNDAMSIDPLSTETDAVDDTDDTRSEGSRSADASVSSHSSRRSTPPNAHLYDYWHDRRSVAFPFVCVADEHSILQRITWGVQDPVIGIALSENGVSARFYFAWTDQHPHGSAMPPVHCVSSSNSTPLDGAFDFSNPDSTLLFASFLLSLRPLYHALVQQCRIAHCSDFTWRADSKSDDQKGPPESWEGKISMWVHHVQSDFSTSSSKSASRCLSDVSKSSAGSAPSNEPQRSNSSRPSSRLAQNQVTPDNQITRPPPGDNVIRGRQKEKGSNSSTKDRSSSERSNSRLAASKLCARSEKGISGDDLSIGSILYDRNVIEVSRIRLATDDTSLSNAALPDKPSTETRALTEEINEVIEGYDALTGYRPLPAKFSVLVESILTPICEVFTAQIKAFEDARQNLDNEDFLIPNEIASATFEPLDEADSSQISESLSLLLWTVESARRVNASVGTGNEAEARLCWDVLIYLSFTGPSENVSTRVLLERMLPLPLNPAADCVASGKADVLKAFAHASLKRTKINRDLCSAAYVLGPQLTAVLRLQFEAAFAASYARQAEVKQFLRGDYAKLILERAEHETDKAKCDCIIAFPAPRLEKSLQYPFLRAPQKRGHTVT